MNKAFYIALAMLFFALPATAQENFWVQIEARQTLTGAQDRAREYARRLDRVNGYFLGDGFYGIFIGPSTQAGAEAELRRLLATGAIPSDSFVKNGRWFQQQFWPVGGSVEQPAAPDEPDAPIAPADESAAQARASERDLTRPERENLQKALKWAGFYEAAIDGSFGRGTRASMLAWQQANSEEPTGILTTRQRRDLMTAYNGILDGMNLRLVRDDASGIQMLVPTAAVEFTEYQPPIVRFDSSMNTDAQMLFISQDGDDDTLRGLYEIFQTLDIIPTQGERSITRNGFEIEGIDDDIHSFTSVGIENGVIKGFTLVWPADDDERRRRLLEEMIPSFQRLDGVLDPGLAPPGEDQAIDMVSGLEIRKPKLSRSGFFLNDNGDVLTTTSVLQSCERITFDREFDAEIIHQDDARGLAILRPVEALAPINVAQFQTAVPRLNSEIAVAGYPYGGVLVTPSLTYGTLSDIRGLDGETDVRRLSVKSHEGDAGGPVFDTAGNVVGMLLPPNTTDGQVLPEDVHFARDADEILITLSAAQITNETASEDAKMTPALLTRRAGDVTVLVSCW